MLLPNAEQAVVEKSKVTEYLLSPDHPDGRSKADFFGRFGFRRQEWEVFAGAWGSLPCRKSGSFPLGNPLQR